MIDLRSTHQASLGVFKCSFLYAHIQFKWCVYSFRGRMEKNLIVSLVKRPAMTRLPSVLRNNKKGEGERDAKMTDDYTQYIRWAILQWQWRWW